jgi:AcrR family transcriptional regulator
MLKKTDTPQRRGGRPSREQSALIEERILDAAADVFFNEGYGMASVEEIARRAEISKRTFYARYADKAAAFAAVVHRIVMRIRPDAQATARLFKENPIKDTLRHVAELMLRASLSPEALSLYRVVTAEATRFPELALIMNEQSPRQEAIRRIAALLKTEAKMEATAAAFAAEQFILMVVTSPQRRALGLGRAMTAREIDAWTKNTVDLFLHGCMAATDRPNTPSVSQLLETTGVASLAAKDYKPPEVTE